MNTKQKKWPTSNDLLAWFIHDQQEMGKLGENPIEVGATLEMFRNTPAREIHKEMWTEYEGFRDAFVSVDGK